MQIKCLFVHYLVSISTKLLPFYKELKIILYDKPKLEEKKMRLEMSVRSICFVALLLPSHEFRFVGCKEYIL